MKKLFVLFLLVALVPFSIGCFGGDDDDSPITTSTLTLSRLFPTGTFSGSLRGATAVSISYSDLFMNITVSGTKIKLVHQKHNNTANGVEVIFGATVLPSVIESVKGANIPAEIQVQPYGITSAVTVLTETIAVPSTITSSSTATAVAPSGSSTTTPATVDVNAVETAVLNEVKKTDSAAIMADPYKVSTAMFGTAEVSQKSGTPTPVSATDGKYVFTLTLNQAYTNTSAPNFSVEVANIKGTTKAITGTPYVAVTWDSTKTIATITVTPSTTDNTYKLTAHETYSITLVSTDATGTDKVKATLPAPYYIYIAQ